MMRRAIGLIAIAMLVACAGSRARPEVGVANVSPSEAIHQSARGVDDAKLAVLLTKHWEWVLSSYPTWATALGDHRFDDRITDDSWSAILRRREQRNTFLRRARNIERSSLSDSDRITLSIFIEQLESSERLDVCNMELWNASAQNNPLETFGDLPDEHVVRDQKSARALLARYRAIPHSVDHTIENLRRGLGRGLVANRHSLALNAKMLRAELAKPVEEWSLSAAPAKWPDFDGRDEVAVALREVVANQIKPALERYLALVEDELIVAARGPDEVGLVALPIGGPCYEARIHNYIGPGYTADELHELGVREIARINREMSVLGGRLFGENDLAVVIGKLRNDPTLYYTSADAMLRDARAALGKAKSSIANYFGTLPSADVVVVPIPDYSAPYTTIAYYKEPHSDGSKPGEYFVNTYRPEVRPRFEMQVLTFHESIPGHHLQIAISKEREELPAFRRHYGSTAFVEGWALYTERLADEMGLYDSDLDLMGMLSFDAWRAARLVVDTGIHAKGWTRAKAEEYMRAHTALSESNIQNEVDRYIVWPGQAVAYKVGQLEILALRDRARAELGDLFEIRSFHDAVLTSGAVSLKVLESNIENWIASHK